MLFNSSLFVLAFLPVTLGVFFILGRLGKVRLAIAWLITASLYFYGFFRIDYMLLLCVVVVVNFGIGRLLFAARERGSANPWLLTAAVIGNLTVLGYFKYMNFVIGNLNGLFATDFVMQQVILPIGISFFTFQIIAYLVDAHRGEIEKHGFLDFALFVTFFPQLIAGPIVHHKEMMPQFREPGIFKINAANLAAGLTLFTIGLLKKVGIADNVSGWSDAYFAAAHAGAALTFVESWVAALAFTFQIYFDFSGYTDMALGLALMIGIHLPVNFNSPYKSADIIDFWRRWHITLSRFLRDYVYISLGGNRHGQSRRYINLMATMLIGGLWHGAAWTFVIWGGLHGTYLIINHAWNYTKERFSLTWGSAIWHRGAAVLLTFIAVVVAWVFFRAESFGAAAAILQGMAGFNGVVLPSHYAEHFGPASGLLSNIGVTFDTTRIGLESEWSPLRIIILGVLLAAVWLLPNSQQLMAFAGPVLEAPTKPQFWSPILFVGRKLRVLRDDGTVMLSAITGFAIGGLVFVALAYQAFAKTEVQSFIYFQF